MLYSQFLQYRLNSHLKFTLLRGYFFYFTFQTFFKYPKLRINTLYIIAALLGLMGKFNFMVLHSVKYPRVANPESFPMLRSNRVYRLPFGKVRQVTATHGFK